MLNVRYTVQFKKDYKLAIKNRIPEDSLILELSRTGTHSDLFKK